MLGHALQLKDKFLNLVPATIKKEAKTLGRKFEVPKASHLGIMFWSYTK